MSDIFKYIYFEGEFSHMANMADGKITYKDDNPWCKYSDVKPLEERIEQLQEDLRALADAVMKAESILRNDLFRSRALNALAELIEVGDIAMNHMSEE